jgi:ferredoxin-type protein NapH
MNKPKIYISIGVFVFVAAILFPVQLMVERPMLITERFWPGVGWFQIFLMGLYGALLFYKMHNPANVNKWRKWSWTLFSVVFFGQLILGISGFETFLMTGDLHLPVPAMIVAGPVYRFEIGFMTILFLTTIILSGPAWCSHFCYFGALDNLAAAQSKKPRSFKLRKAFSITTLSIVVAGALLMCFLGTSAETAAIAGGIFGIIGIGIILSLSRKQRMMVHCTAYCPVGTVINYLGRINPFRMYIDNNCTSCNLCTRYCLYDALRPEDIANKKPGTSCTLCGDCVTSCHAGSIKYKFLSLSPEASRNLYLFITVGIHTVFLALARI